MRLTHDEVLAYGWPAGPKDARCHLRIFDAAGQVPVVIVGQFEDNPGPSVVNAIEYIASLVAAKYFEDGREFMLFDYWPKQSGVGLMDLDEHYKLIELEAEGPVFHSPEWPQQWTREEMEELVGQELPSFIEGRYRIPPSSELPAG
jgi:hypothetical protein